LQAPLSTGKFSTYCPYGSVTQVLDFGVANPAEGGVFDLCINTDATEDCKPEVFNYIDAS
jgi:hypothetical protein